MKPRKRKSDPPEVAKLFELHNLLNHGGRHWIKGYFHKRRNGVMCYCLEGGLDKLTNYGRRRSLRRGMNNLLVAVLPLRYGSSLVHFNDSPDTEWDDVQDLIYCAIENSRS